MVIWWLASWTNLAAWAAIYTAVDSTYTYCYSDGVCVKSKRDLVKRHVAWRSYRDALAAAAGIGAVNL
jgi:hypothetical protein